MCHLASTMSSNLKSVMASSVSHDFNYVIKLQKYYGFKCHLASSMSSNFKNVMASKCVTWLHGCHLALKMSWLQVSSGFNYVVWLQKCHGFKCVTWLQKCHGLKCVTWLQ